MASIDLDNVSVRYGDQVVLRNITAEVPDGTVLGVIGPSGSGKSTLLRAVAGLDELDDGKVLFDGIDMAGRSPSDRNIGMVFQDSVMYPSRTVRRNVAFPLEIRKLPTEEVSRRVEAEARVLEIERLLERYPKTLSAGHQQLVQAARAFVRAPTVFLMDEPLARLDAKLRATMRRELSLLQRGYGVTMIYATNDQVEALALADSLLVIDQGVVRQVGAPMDVYHRPSDRFVAEFVGSPPMAFVRGSVVRDGSGFLVGLMGEQVRAWDPRLDEAVGRWVEVGVRPEEVTLDGGELQGTVVSVEYTGDYGWCSISVEGGTLTARSESVPPPIGTKVSFGFIALHVFDESGRALAHVRFPGAPNV